MTGFNLGQVIGNTLLKVTAVGNQRQWNTCARFSNCSANIPCPVQGHISFLVCTCKDPPKQRLEGQRWAGIRIQDYHWRPRSKRRVSSQVCKSKQLHFPIHVSSSSLKTGMLLLLVSGMYLLKKLEPKSARNVVGMLQENCWQSWAAEMLPQPMPYWSRWVYCYRTVSFFANCLRFVPLILSGFYPVTPKVDTADGTSSIVFTFVCAKTLPITCSPTDGMCGHVDNWTMQQSRSNIWFPYNSRVSI